MIVSRDNFICGWLAFSIGMLSLTCSMTTLYLIYKMKHWNGYMLLVSSLVVCQMLYDVGHVLEIDYTFSACMAKKFLNYLGGLSVCFWTVIISYIVLYVTLRSRSLNIYANYKYFFTFAILPPLFLSIVIVAGHNVVRETETGSCFYQGSRLAQGLYKLYYWTRLSTIIFNFTAVSFITGWLYSQRFSQDRKFLAIYTLVNRMKYYPLVQAICRSGAAWNEWNNGKNQSFASYVLASIMSPLTGTAYFCVFLIMQPNALTTFKSLLPCIFKSTVVTVRDSTVRESEKRASSFVSNPSEFQNDSDSAVSGDTTKMGENELESIINDDKTDISRQGPDSLLLSIFSKPAASSLTANTTNTVGTSTTRFTLSPMQKQPKNSIVERDSVVDKSIGNGIDPVSRESDGSHFVV